MKAWEFNCQRMHSGCYYQDLNTVLKMSLVLHLLGGGKQLLSHFLKTTIIFISSTHGSAGYTVGTQICVQWSRSEECVTLLFLELLCDSITGTLGVPGCLPPFECCAELTLLFSELSAAERDIHSWCRHVFSLSPLLLTWILSHLNSYKFTWSLHTHSIKQKCKYNIFMFADNHRYQSKTYTHVANKRNNWPSHSSQRLFQVFQKTTTSLNIQKQSRSKVKFKEEGSNLWIKFKLCSYFICWFTLTSLSGKGEPHITVCASTIFKQCATANTFSFTPSSFKVNWNSSRIHVKHAFLIHLIWRSSKLGKADKKWPWPLQGIQ